LLLVDAGTSYFKIFNIQNKTYEIVNILDTNKINFSKVILATGHNKHLFSNAKKINELVCLSKGVKSKKNSFSIIDIGSRDIKQLQFINNKFIKCDWNSSCGAMIGFTLELLSKYFNINYNELEIVNAHIDITCGLLGISSFFDIISKNNQNINKAMSSLMHGFAKYVYNFCDKENFLYISGGLSENQLFINYLNQYHKNINTVGRFVLIEGLKTYL